MQDTMNRTATATTAKSVKVTKRSIDNEHALTWERQVERSIAGY